MLVFTIETTYHMPVLRHRTYSADSPEVACPLAIEDEDWSEQMDNLESSGETYVTGIWEGDNAGHTGAAIPVAPHFQEAMQRQAQHFEILLGLLKIMVFDARISRETTPDWLTRAAWAVAMAEAILAGARGPDEPEGTPRPRHILAALQEDRVHDLLPTIVEVDDPLPPNAVTDVDIHAACLGVAETIDLAEEIGGAEFRAALAALKLARARHPRDA
ncbi:MAG: hypothetical protein ABS75_32485 [Pelagibacterium sp. SCN 63-23]|nr:MAG: hypothetical protein ABS75_32485 [Pelagibacterium sp. SCN 63-23]